MPGGPVPIGRIPRICYSLTMRKKGRFICILLALTLLISTEAFAARETPCVIRVGEDGNLERFPHLLEYYLNIDSKEYSPGLAHMLGAVAYSAYKESNIRRSFYSLGFAGFKCYNYYANFRDGEYSSDSCGFTIGKRILSDGSSIVLIAIRGTYGSSEDKDLSEEEKEGQNSSPIGQDWMSNFNTGWVADSSGLHKGFNTAAGEVFDTLKKYLRGLPQKNVKYVITGHSRGAAVGNLLAYRLMNEGISADMLYDYNFACPNTVYNDDEDNPVDISGYDNIFNISNCADIIAHLPGLFEDTMEYYNLDSLMETMTFGVSKFGKGWEKFGNTLYFCRDWDDEALLGLDFSFEAHTPKTYLEYLRLEYDAGTLKSWDSIREDVLENTSLSGLLQFNLEYLPG